MRLKKPILLHLYVTYRCNARCAFCDFWIRTPYRGITSDLDPDTGRATIDDARRLGVKFVDFAGGEPLLYSHLPDLLRFARSKMLYTSVTTNCILYPQKARELKGLVDILHFSIDGPDKEIHDALRGRPTFDRLTESIEIARKLGERPDLLFTVTAENISTVHRMADFAAQHRLMLVINPEFTYFDGRKPGHIDSNELRKIGKLPYVYLNTAFLRLRDSGGNDPATPRCRAMSSTIVIDPQGKLLIPCFHRCTERVDLNDGLTAVYLSERMKNARRMEGRYDFCAGCAINCYFDPSFLYRLDRYFVDSLLSKAKYGWEKLVKREG